jgi:hypothetical protein
LTLAVDHAASPSTQNTYARTQERALLAAGNTLSNYYMPANADLSVIMWRQWLSRHAGAVPTCTPADTPLMPPLMSKQQVRIFCQHR